MAKAVRHLPDRLAAAYDRYAAAIERDGHLDLGTGRAYLSRVRSYLDWLGSAGLSGPDPLADPHGRDSAVQDYRSYLMTSRGLSVTAVYAHLTALARFYGHLGLGPPRVQRDQPPRRAPRILAGSEQMRYLHAAGRRPQARDRAIGGLLFYSGLRVTELTALDVSDVPLSACKGTVIVRSGNPREIPLLDPSARSAVADWIAERAGWLGSETSPLLLNRRGGRLSARAVGQLVDGLAKEADLTGGDGRPGASPQTLRETFRHNLLQAGADIGTVAGLMGQRYLDTARLHTRPAAADLEAAVAKLPAFPVTVPEPGSKS
jgi:site-specific recombinase XerC